MDIAEAGLGEKTRLETGFESFLFGSRWLMAPMYLGLVVALALLTIVFLRELAHYVPQVMTLSVDGAILAILTLIDLTLAANLLVIVLFSGYENCVSQLDIGDATDRPAWMGTVDVAGRKMKLIASIVAISGIHLLKRFMEIGKGIEIDEAELYWLVVIHVVFVVSGLLMAAMDWLVARSGKK